MQDTTCCPTSSSEKPEVKNPVGNPSGEPKKNEKSQLLPRHKGWYTYEESFGGVPGVNECLQLGGSGEEESGHRGRKVFRKLNSDHVG